MGGYTLGPTNIVSLAQTQRPVRGPRRPRHLVVVLVVVVDPILGEHQYTTSSPRQVVAVRRDLDILQADPRVGLR